MPLGARVLVRLIPSEDRTGGGLYLPAGAKDSLSQAGYGRVIEVARATIPDEEGFGTNVSGIPHGSNVLFPKERGLTVPWDDTLRILETKDVHAIIEEIPHEDAH